MQQPKLIVGLGASAGGLNEFKTFFSNVSPDTGLAFVVVQHLDPSRESRIPDILQRHTEMPVSRIEHGVAPQPNHVYTIPSNKLVEYAAGRLVLQDRRPQPKRRAVDHFFCSLADEAEQRAVAVVLSGAGNDGTLGLRKVHAAGGLTLVQSEDEATHRGMPGSAARSGVADFIVSTSQMPDIIERYARHSYAERGELQAMAHKQADGPGPRPSEDGGADATFQRLRALLKSRESFDLNKYKGGTVKRRLGRRMGMAGMDSLQAYLDLVRDNREERKALVSDILIGVTEFFRDPDAFKALQAEVVTDLVKRAAQQQRPIRFWSAGCSTGEEAYSLAMLVLDAADGLNRDIDLQIFATDPNDNAVAHARRGIYPRSLLQNLSEGQRVKYFESVDENLMQVRQGLRDCISFAHHDLTRDPPFSRMDLISCRNVLIYLQPEVQQKIQRDFHFALRHDGHLFLGTADALSVEKEAFETISSQWRIYGKNRMPADPRKWSSFAQRLSREPNKPTQMDFSTDRDTSRRKTVADASQHALLDAFVPPSLVVSEAGHVIYTHGEINAFLKLPAGEPDLHISKMLDEELRTRVMAAIYKARREDTCVELETISSATQGLVDVRVQPAPDTEDISKGSVLLAFSSRDDSTANAVGSDDDSVSRELERELESTREALRTTVEELETSNEQLRSSHEEALSMNEELQSTNEELEATSEELRSMNEELVTINDQLQDKIDELQRANEDLSNFMASTKLATVFLDEDLCIRRFTPAAAKLLDINRSHDGQSVRDLKRELLGFDLPDDAEHVLDQLSPQERHIEAEDGSHFLRHVLPYRTQDNRIQGVVVAFNDITKLHNAQQTLRERETQQELIAQLSWQALTLNSVDTLAESAVRALRRTLNVEFCGIFRPLDDDRMVLQHGRGFGDGAVGQLDVGMQRDSFLAYASRAPRAVAVENLADDLRFNLDERLAGLNVVGAIGVTVSGTSEPPGVLCAFTTQKRDFSADKIEFLSSVAGILSVAGERALAEEQLRRSEKQSRQRLGEIDTIYRTAPVGLAVVDRDSRVLKINHRLAQAADCSPDECEGIPLDEALPPELCAQVLESLQKVRAHGDPIMDAEVVATGPSEDSLVWECSYVPLSSTEDGCVDQISCVFHDISERRRHKHELEQAAAELQRASRQKDQFLAMLGHELRNPLAAIRSAVELQQKIDSANAVVERTREVLDRQTAHMSSIVDRLLDNSRLARQKLDIDTAPLDLAAVIDEVVERHTGLDERRLTIDVRSSQEPMPVDGDRVRLVQVFDNLLSNAIDHSPRGATIELRAERVDDSYVISVQDEGDGIESAVADTLFEPFIQGEQSLSREQGGLGLGLSLAKGLVELHHGELSAQNNGRGARFTVRLPAASALDADSKPHEDSPSASTQQGHSIALVEDNEDARTLLAEALKLHGHQVETAGRADTLFELLDAGFAPDAIVCDIGLPGEKSGYDIARELRADSRWDGVVLIALTGYGSPGNLEDAAKAGFDHHMTKPADLTELNALLGESD
ncbi:response regulator [Persicimonas caeni]|uniref:Response regulator n=1 Tax=Persicimonas caeni TaxID=2292766 RepID=A0A4Y6Q0H4_PERCE|nr:CheR family methyltransferase [Persicimonas caeni]QDG54088.1 response regulator [Persicimonas caeni]QED35309.1 response regulator [Persicimonas caeni]